MNSHTAAQHAAMTAEAVDLFDSSNFPKSLTLDSAISRVAEIHGKEIRVEYVGTEEWETVTALLIEHDAYASILIRATDTPLYQAHCILHELGHILYQHPGCRAMQTTAAPLLEEAVPSYVRARTLGDGTAQAGGFVEGNTKMEAEAEHFAHLLARTILRPRNLDSEKVFG